MKFPEHETTAINTETGLPEGWSHRKCFDVMDVLSGGTPKTKTEEYWNGEIRFFTPKDAKNGVYTEKTEKTITQLGLDKCNSKLYPKNTVFITARGTVGKLNIASEPMAMNQSCYALKAKKGLTQYFLYCALQKTIGAFKGAANGGVFDTIVVDTFRYLPFVQPSKSVVKDFDLKVTPIFYNIQNLLNQNSLLTEARDILLPRLMTGLIDVDTINNDK
jgi:type I restriction enzyme S subunit